MPAIIRNYRPEDLESCQSLWVELTDWHRRIYQSPGIGGSNPGRQFDEHLERVGADLIWVAEVEAKVVGLAGLIPGDSEAELEPLVVSGPYRSRGIGRRLVESVLSAARERGFRQVKVRPVARNESAIRFFHEAGFEILGQIELFTDFSPPEHQVWRTGEHLAGKDFKV